jgi:hypothetical protein
MTRHGAVGPTRAAKGGAALLFSIVSTLGLSCGSPPGQFVIIQNQVPVTGGCGIPAAVSNAYRGSGDLDVRLVQTNATVGYAVFPVMQNNLPPPEDEADLNRIKVQGFDVDVALPEDAPPGPITDLFARLETEKPYLLHYSIPFSASISSGGGNTSAAVDAVPAALAQEIRNTGELTTTAFAYLTTTIHVRGQTDSKRSVTSDPFVFPVRVCDGCLIASVSACPVTTEPTHLGNACNVAQDDPVDCCTLGTSLVCPPRVAAQ